VPHVALAFALALFLVACGERDSVASNSGTAATGGSGASLPGDSGSDGASSGGSGGVLPSGPPTLQRIGATFAVASLTESSPKRFCDVAHDPNNDVYAIVYGNAATGASIVDADGNAQGTPLAVAQTTAWTQGSSVSFGDADSGFLVAWHDTRDDPNQARPRARLLKYDGSGIVFPLDDFALDADPSHGEAPPRSAYSSAQKKFLVAWQAKPADDIHARFVSSVGPTGNELVLTDDPDWQSDVSIAYNPTRDEFLVAWTHAGAGQPEVRARRVSAVDGALVGDIASVGQAAGTWLASAVFLPNENSYLVAWFGGVLTARRLSQEGVLDADPFEFASGYGTYDGFAIAASAVSGTLAATFHGPSDEDFAAALNASGEESAVIQATDEPGDEGHFNPRIAAHSTRAEWLLVTSRGFTQVVAQRLGP
jgi:hypothetical protein